MLYGSVEPPRSRARLFYEGPVVAQPRSSCTPVNSSRARYVGRRCGFRREISLSVEYLGAIGGNVGIKRFRAYCLP
jgi:hypothetical protein